MAMLSMGFNETSLNTIAFLCFMRVMGFPRPVVLVVVGSGIQHSVLRVEDRGLRIEGFEG